MQRLFSAFGQGLRKSFLILGLITLLSLSNLFMFASQPAYATSSLTPEEKIDRAYEYSEATGFREEDRAKAYEQALQKAEDPEQVYEDNLKNYQDTQPDQGLIEGAKKLVEKVTGE